MKSKLFRILGVVAVVAMLATSIVAPVSANVSGVSATITSGTATINATGNYSVYATLTNQLLGTSSHAVSLPEAGSSVTFISVATTDKFKVVVTGAAPTVSYPVGTGGAYNATTGIITFNGTGAAIGDTVKLTTTSDATVITYTETVGLDAVQGIATVANGVPTVAAAPGGAFTLPNIGDAVTFAAAAATDVITLGINPNLNVVFSPVGTATFVKATGVITFSAVGQTATVTSTVSQTTGTWITTTGAPTVSPVTNVAPVAATTGAPVANGDSITITFPAGFTVAASPFTPIPTIQATAGWVAIPPATTPTASVAALFTNTVWSSSTTALTVTATLGAGDKIGASSQVLINITNGVSNPATAGSYTVNVATSQETTAVTSNAITISNPVIAPLPGVATVYNSAGTAMGNSNDFAVALALAQSTGDGCTIKVTAGTYNTAFGNVTKTVSILGQGTTSADVILKSTTPWMLSGKTIVIDKVTVDNTTASLSVAAAAGGTATISNSALKGGAVNVGGIAPTLDTDTVTVATGAVGVNVTAAATVKNSTFTVAGTGLGISASAALTVSGSTFTGTTGAGLGVVLTAGSGSIIGTSKFTGLTTAFSVTGGAAGTFTGNTVDVCGIATTGPSTIEIGVGGNGVVLINGNTITNSLYSFLNVAAAGTGSSITVLNNTFKGNAKNITNASATSVNATHNFWSGAAVPADVTTAPNLATYNPAIGAAPSAAAFGAPGTGGTFDASAAGVKFSASVGATYLSAAALGANPVAVALPTTVTLKRYFDVYSVGTVTGVTTIQFYGATGAAVVAADAVYFYNSTTGQWLPASSQTVNVFGGYVEITINGTTTAPTAAQLSGLPFALVTVNPVAPPVVSVTGDSLPAQAATDVDVNTSFQWAAVAGADHYDFVLAEDLGTTNKFDIIDYSMTTPVNGAPSKETLKYNTIYWWRVRSVSAAGVASAWTNYFFTTGDVPPVVTTTSTTPPVITTIVTSVVVTQPAPVTTVVTTTGLTITNTQTSTEAIPSYLLWAVIAVGAILIISVIVLIVRTRKI